MWMTDEKNPLVSRTIVNRLWEQLFGTGLVETLEDMGTQGIAPTHRELLDYLAWKFMHDDHWSIKQSLKYLVMSSTYRQESRIGKDQLEKDPFNKWYGRGPRVRLSAEQVRDQALFCSGLLSGKMYGQPVMPWQPAGIWHSPYSAERWVKSPGQDQYRRAIYTYWKRTAPFPSMIAFDGASREVCSARRIRTNTPLQALVTLNDSVYLEAARGLAIRMSSFGDHAIDKGYELLMYKPIEKGKADILQALYKKAVEKFAADPEKACAMMGESGPRTSPQAAAMTVVAGALLNLDEVITKN